ncbi:PREDICTED: uncharacterized protein LOC109583651 [Amphimedon queenslandica]|uniref:Uncharacterized protein n=1 Tax=Amphimedon queenslandica TaxID=400682 RepID=A0AAN0JCY5_AMPQE|nr:PREDICTED: uncharacterized protein LOC109583651 [Amphimedon queenslandica]|eukprot:XP_019854642.1 PREDICTED: uncharacterized protein LOC109583651 [Amphimedon queenslandica]
MYTLSYIEYQIISIAIPVALALVSCIAVVVGGIKLGLDKVVRKVFPYVKKKEEAVLLVVFYATYIFFSSFTDISYKYDPFDPFDCFFYSNWSLVQATPEEALILEENVLCFTVNLNIGRAMGQATGTLAFSWIFSSVIIWISIELKKKRMKATEERNNKRCYSCCLLLIVCYIPACLLSMGLIAIGIIAVIHKFTTLVSSIEIITCGSILGLQIKFLIISDVVLCINNLKQQRQRRATDDKKKPLLPTRSSTVNTTPTDVLVHT